MNSKSAIQNVANIPNKFDKYGGPVTGETIFNDYLSINSWSGYGTGKSQIWFDGNNKNLIIENTNELRLGNNIVYHAGNKPPSLSTARKITLTGSVTGNVAFDGSKDVSITTTTNHTHDYLPLRGGTVTGETIFNDFLSINSWPNYGTGKSQIWFDGNSKNLIIENTNALRLGNNIVYHTANKPTAADVGAIPASKMTVSQTAPSNPSTGDLWISW